MLRNLILYAGMVLIASSVWYLVHTLFGGDEACFDTLEPNDSPIGCSTGLQLFVQVLIAFWVSFVILLTPLIITKLLRKSQKYGINFSAMFWAVVVVLLGFWHTMNILDEYGFQHSFQMGIGEISLPYLLAILFFWFVESRLKNVTRVSI